MITANVICDSISESGVRITTMELEYPRIIHSEFLTHRMFSRNAASSRAIPFDKMVKQLDGIPSRFGANVSGMQDDGQEHDGLIEGRVLSSCFEGDDYYTECHSPEQAWDNAKQDAVFWSESFAKAGYHKQVFNRLTEPFQMIKVLVTATEYANFFWLRNDGAADPTLQELAAKMLEAYNASEPNPLQAGEWHLPYVEQTRMLANNKQQFGPHVDSAHNSAEYFEYWTVEDAIKVSAARCAAVSFRNTDYTLEKSLQVYARLIGSERKHASAFEHQATPIRHGMLIAGSPKCWDAGITHRDKELNLWSGNFRGWIQYRKTIEGENYTGEF